MEYTQEQINKLINDPVVQLLSIVTGTPVDKMVSDIKIKKVDNCKPETNLSTAEYDDSDRLYPLTEDDLFAIVNVIKRVYNEANNLVKLGIDIWSTDFGEAVFECMSFLAPYINENLNNVDWVNKDVSEIMNYLLTND